MGATNSRAGEKRTGNNGPDDKGAQTIVGFGPLFSSREGTARDTSMPTMNPLSSAPGRRSASWGRQTAAGRQHSVRRVEA